MAFGFEVHNATDNLVIDNTYQNLSLQVKQDFALPAGGLTTVTATNCVAPMLCVNATDYVGMYGLSVSGSTYTWKLKASAASSGSFYVFDFPHAAHSASFGMKVLAADGVTEVFNSDNKYFRVETILDVPWSAAFNGPASTFVVTGPTASVGGLQEAKYAVCLSQPRVNTSYLGNNNYRRTFDGMKTTATFAAVSQAITVDFNSGIPGSGGDHPGIFDGVGSGTKPALIVNVEGL
jgi:hypothetical protein